MSLKEAIGSGPILMVDDSELDILMATRCFQRSSLPNRLETMTSGVALLDYLDRVEQGHAEMPALVLLDINMPGMTGFEALEKVRSRERFRTMPVIMMLTNSDHPDDIARAKELRANGFQTKPYMMSEYVSFLNSLAGE